MGKIIIFSSIGLAFTASVFLLVTYGKSHSEPLPVLGSVSDIKLIDSSGNKYQVDRLKGKVTIADFFFTSCKGICPSLTQQMGSLQKRFEGSPEFQLLSISVDPEKDTPETLTAYATDNKLKLENWDFLTGSREDVRSFLFGQLKIGMPDDPLTHSDRLVLLDPDLQIRGYYSLSDPNSLQKLRKDASRLLQ
ncbi:MAG: SCO family protein [Verrucomicrobia bacterium]|nr:SCO family protein [Verrucomicrobiota bacterium]